MIGYLDLPSGISGDMFLGCLVDAGWSIDRLRTALTKLKLPTNDWAVEAREVKKGPAPLRATLVDVRVAEPVAKKHSFVMTAQSHAHEHPHRNLDDIRGIIEASELAPEVKAKSVAVFTRLAHAEAKVHGSGVEQIHFHEVGALDAIVDIVGSVAGLHELGIDRLYASALPLGHGWVDSQHGKLPLPAPATLELISAAGALTCPAPGPGELVTPTGAALVCELATFGQPTMRLDRVAVGAGQRETAWPNVARLWLGEDPAADTRGTILQIETNIDDMNPQHYGPLTDRLLAAGALDVWLTPVQMKKGRPGVIIGAILPAAKQREIADILLRETTTLGVRVHPVQRVEADREVASVSTPLGTVGVKLKRLEGAVLGAMPEYEDCRRIATEKGVPVRTVYESALSAAYQAFIENKS